MNTLIAMPTRIAARTTNKNFKASGKLSTLVDKGCHLKGADRWGVLVAATIQPKQRKAIKVSHSINNKGFDLRAVTSGVKGYDLYLDGEFILRRDTKLAAYESGVKMAVSAKIDYSTLNYK
jgi:hypothetical protein